MEMKDCEAYLVYHIDEGLSWVSVETTDRRNFILAHEYIIDEKDKFTRREGTGS